jgi:acyl dehydratase
VHKITETLQLNTGLTYEQMTVGLRFRTSARTLTAADLITFVTLAGFNEPLFLDAQYAQTAGFAGRLVPGALTYSVAEGLIIQTRVLANTGIAFVHMELDAFRPVYVGDTLETVVEITESRASRTPGRGVVKSRNVVINQHSEDVLVYTAVRIIRGHDFVEA